MKIPSYYEFHNPVKILAGEGALEKIPSELAFLRAKKPIIITDPGIEKAGLMKTVLKALRDSDLVIGAIFNETPSDSSIHTVNSVANIYLEHECDSIIAIGGGSVLDTAKGLNIAISEETDDIRDFMGVDRLIRPQRPLIAIPTTVGTGSEVTQVAVIADPDKNHKILFTSSLLIPTIAVIDPRMIQSLPVYLTAATSMDALTHAVEAYSCLQKNPLSDVYARTAIELIRDNLFLSLEHPKDKESRFSLANAATFAGIAFSNSMVGAVHSIGHACGAVAHVHHGVAMAILLPYVMEYNLDTVGILYGELLASVGGADAYEDIPFDARADKCIQIVRKLGNNLNKIAGIPISLKDAGISEEQINIIAQTAINDGSLITNPKEMDEKDIVELLKKAL